MNNFMQWYTDSLLQCFFVFLFSDSTLANIKCITEVISRMNAVFLRDAQCTD